eukprot:6192554-Pleurochrysis_carterae.AAC.2
MGALRYHATDIFNRHPSTLSGLNHKRKLGLRATRAKALAPVEPIDLVLDRAQLLLQHQRHAARVAVLHDRGTRTKGEGDGEFKPTDKR